jgi:NADH-quinone oxidoreductase subunit E
VRGGGAPAGGGEPAAGEEEGPSPEKPANLYAEAPSDADDLKLIKGIGPGLESQLNAIGVYRFDQIAELSEANLVWINENLTSFKGRCFRDDWVGQAKELMG